MKNLIVIMLVGIFFVSNASACWRGLVCDTTGLQTNAHLLVQIKKQVNTYEQLKRQYDVFTNDIKNLGGKKYSV